MTAQPKLFATDSNNIRFEAYDEANPEVWKRFKELAMALYLMGRRHLHGKAIAELMRLGAYVKGKEIIIGPDVPLYAMIGDEVWTTEGKRNVKINNTYISYYVRRFVSKYPVYRYLFEMRRAQEDIRID